MKRNTWRALLTNDANSMTLLSARRRMASEKTDRIKKTKTRMGREMMTLKSKT